MRSVNYIRAILAGSAAVIMGAILPVNAGNAVWKGTASGVWDDGALNWEVDGVPNQPFTDGDSVTFDNSASTYTIITSNTVAPSSVLVSNTTTYTFTKVSIGGTGQLIKAGTGTLSIPRDTVGTNSYTGGTVVNGGILSFTFDNPLGDPAGPLTVNGAQLNLGDRSWSSTRPVILTGNNTFRAAGNCNWTCAGPVSGSGGLTVGAVPNGGSSIKLTSTSNSFTGEFGVVTSLDRFTCTISSLVDSPGAGNIYITPHNTGSFYPTLIWGGNATNALVLNYRSMEFRGNGNMGPFELRNASGSHPIIINTDFLVTGSGIKTFRFNASNSGITNVIAGDISDGTNGAVVALTKIGNGALVLSGINTYSGTNTLSGGTLILEGEESLADNGTLNITSGKVDIQTREKVSILLTNDVPCIAGIWGSTISKADYTNDTYFSGKGLLYVGVDFPPEGTVLIIR